MPARIKPLSGQVIVVAGAAGALGQAVARLAAEAGAAVILTADDETAVRRAAEGINASGGRAHAVPADLSDPEAAARVGRAAIARFGGFDTWIQAGDEPSGANGVREATRHFRETRTPGVLVHMARVPLSRDQRRAVRRARAHLTQIDLPAGALKTVDIAAATALHAAVNPVGRMAIGRNGKLTLYAQARKHRGVVAGVGLLAMVGVAAWFARDRIAEAARPRLSRRVAPPRISAAARRPLLALRAWADRSRQALRRIAARR